MPRKPKAEGKKGAERTKREAKKAEGKKEEDAKKMEIDKEKPKPKKKENKDRKPKAKSSHPPYRSMVLRALRRDPFKRGVSLVAVRKYVNANYTVPKEYGRFVSQALKRMVRNGDIEKVRASYRLKGAVAAEGKRKKKKEKSPAKKRAKPAAAEGEKEAPRKKKKDGEAKPAKGRKKAEKSERKPKKATEKKPRKKAASASPAAVVAPVFAFDANSAVKGDEQTEFPERAPKSTGPDSGVTEIVFSFDTTGSMSGAIAAARKNITETCERLFSDVPKIRIGLIAHGDYCDGPSTKHKGGPYHFTSLDLSQDAKAVIQWVNDAHNPTSGGDGQENYEMVLEQVQNMSWTSGSTRALVLIGDNIPHTPQEAEQQMKTYSIPNPRQIDWRAEADNCWKMGIKVYGVQCSGGGVVDNFYKAVAGRTCGTVVKLDSFNVVKDLILSVCFREVSVERMQVYEKEVIAEGRMNESMNRMFRQVSGEVVPELKKTASKGLNK